MPVPLLFSNFLTMMEVHKRILATLLTLLYILHPVFGGKTCSDLRNLENGQTFFRYGGLFVIFHCHHGYKLHGHKTNSCASGRWSRDPPICVGSGCPSPGPVAHGSISVDADGSWVVFTCDTGYKLVGPSVLYCKGHEWNSSTPVCEESDMMHALSGVTAQKPSINHTLQAAVDVKAQLSSRFKTQAAFKDTTLYFEKSDSNTDRIEVTTQPQLHSLFTSTTSSEKKESQIEHHTFPTPVTVPEPTPSAALTTTITKTKWTFLTPYATTSTNAPTKPAAVTTVPPSQLIPSTVSATFSDKPTTQNVATDYSKAVDEDQTALNGFQTVHLLLQSAPVKKEEIVSTFTTVSFLPTTSSPATASENNIFSTTPKWTQSGVNGKSNLSLLPSGLPSCPYPSVPAHGTFYFINKETPGPIEYGNYIQYVCYPGYTLAHGDARSHCQEGGTWSGVTPVCLELTACSVNNGGCSQLCAHSHLFNQDSNQTHISTRCLCRPGFALLQDGRTCRDVDECVEGQHQCQHKCINTFGSFQCVCDEGFQPSPDRTSCTDVDECALPTAVTGCVFGCVNSPGSFHCQCPAGYRLQSADTHCQDIDECAVNAGLGPCSEQCHNSPGSFHCSCSYGHTLAGDGLSCIDECPNGYKKQPIKPQNTTLPLKDSCVDINECEEEMCEWQCVNLPGSYRCICPKGYTLTRDGRGCRDINECSRKNGGCSHLCINRKGSYKCACPPSHRLSPYSWKKCILRQL